MCFTVSSCMLLPVLPPCLPAYLPAFLPHCSLQPSYNEKVIMSSALNKQAN